MSTKVTLICSWNENYDCIIWNRLKKEEEEEEEGEEEKEEEEGLFSKYKTQDLIIYAVTTKKMHIMSNDNAIQTLRTRSTAISTTLRMVEMTKNIRNILKIGFLQQ